MVDARLGGTRHGGRGMATLPEHVHDVSADQAAATHHKNSHAESSTVETPRCQGEIDARRNQAEPGDLVGLSSIRAGAAVDAPVVGAYRCCVAQSASRRRLSCELLPGSVV